MTKLTKDLIRENPSHKKELARLNIIIGQVQGIQKMIVEQRYCIDIVSQIYAIQSALSSVSMEILSKHLDSCVLESLNNKDETYSKEKIDEIKKLLKLWQ